MRMWSACRTPLVRTVARPLRLGQWLVVLAVSVTTPLTGIRAAHPAPPDPTMIFVDGDAPINGGGTAAAPFNTLVSLDTALELGPHANVTIFLAGTFNGEQLEILGGLTNCTFQQWPGHPQATIRGDTPITGVWTEVAPGTHYSIPVSSLGGIISVVEDWDIRIDRQGRHYGHMKIASSPAMVPLTPGSWFFDGIKMHIHPSDGANPNTSGRVYAHCRHGNAWSIHNGVNVTIDGLHFNLWVDPAAGGTGYAIFMAQAYGCTIRNCVATDYGYHGFGFVGLSCKNNTFENCVTRGGRDNGSTGFVFFTQSGFMTGCKAVDCDAHLHQTLDVLGNPVDGTEDWSPSGFYAHTGSGIISDLELHRCDAYGYEESGGFGFSAGANLVSPAVVTDPDLYGMRVYDSRLINGVHNGFNQSARIAFVRCDFDFLRMTEFSGQVLDAFRLQIGSTILMESCTIRMNADGLVDSGCFALGDISRLVLQGSTVYDHGLSTGVDRAFVKFMSATPLISASQTLFAHRAPRKLAMAWLGVVPSALSQDFNNCWYRNIQPFGYSPNPLFDSTTEFIAAIDPPGVYNIDPQFIAPPLDLEGVIGGPLSSTVLVLPGIDRLGINLLDYSGNYGAYQYGGVMVCPADLNDDDKVDGMDLALLLGNWGKVSGSAADFTLDGVVNGIDLALLLSAWGPC
jgi:Right handed beta helix region